MYLMASQALSTRSPEHPMPRAGSSAGITPTPASLMGQPRLFGNKSAFPGFISCFVEMCHYL